MMIRRSFQVQHCSTVLRVAVFACVISAPAALAEQANQTIYKLTDYYGHVTYANSPMTGAVKVVLEPLSVITLSTPRPLPSTLPDAIAITSPGVAKAMLTDSAETLSAGTMTNKRRDEIRRRVVEAEMQEEQQLLNAAKQTLDMEGRDTDSFRAVRASLSNAAAAGTSIDPAQKALVEKHFERKRALLDEIDAHERNLAMLKLEIRQVQNISLSSSN